MENNEEENKEEKKMRSALAEKYPNLKVGLDYKKMLESFELPKSKDDTIILNPKNEAHVKWFNLEDGEDNE